MNPNDLDSAIAALQKTISILEGTSDSLEFWLKVWTGLVVVGVALEVIIILKEHFDERRAWRRSTIRTPEKPSLLFLVFQLIATGLVTLGVAGELYISVLSGRTNSDLRIKNQALVALVDQKAGFANAQAANAETSANNANAAASSASAEADKARLLARDARLEADSARQSVNEASNQLAKLRQDSQKLEAEANKTKSDLMNLAVCNAPRVINHWLISPESGPTHTYVDSLTPRAGQAAYIEAVPDAESRRAAIHIAQTLLDAKWDVRLPVQTVDGLVDGVSVQVLAPPRAGPAGVPMPDFSAFQYESKVAEEFVDFLRSYNWQAREGVAKDGQGNIIHDATILPRDTIRIQVGLYLATIYVSPPGQQTMNADLAEFKRRREERVQAALNRMSPEDRKKFQESMEALKEWEGQHDTSKDPCQALDPLD